MSHGTHDHSRTESADGTSAVYTCMCECDAVRFFRVKHLEGGTIVVYRLDYVIDEGCDESVYNADDIREMERTHLMEREG